MKQHDPRAAPPNGSAKKPKEQKEEKFGCAKLILEALVLTLLIFGIYYISPFDLVTTSTDSMEPELPIGSFSVAIKVNADTEYQVGDIITFSADYGEIHYSRITHRIVAIYDDGTIQTKGDHNEENDPFTITSAQIVNKVKWSNVFRKK